MPDPHIAANGSEEAAQARPVVYRPTSQRIDGAGGGIDCRSPCKINAATLCLRAFDEYQTANQQQQKPSHHPIDQPNVLPIPICSNASDVTPPGLVVLTLLLEASWQWKESAPPGQWRFKCLRNPSYPFAPAAAHGISTPWRSGATLTIRPPWRKIVSESLPVNDPGTQKRRSTRIVQAVPITVSGVDALGQPFKERTTTVMVNCHGCKYQSKHYVPKNSVVTLEIPRMEPAFPPRIVPGHVVWVQRPRTVRELFQIGLEFESAGNVWGIAFPPEDWVPCADEPAAASSAPSESPSIVTETSLHEISTAAFEAALEKPAASSSSIPAPPSARAPIPPPPRSTAPAPPVAKAPQPAPPAPPSAVAIPSAPSESKVHVMPSPPAAGQDAQLAVARQMAKIVAEAKETLDKTLRRGAQTAINEEMVVVRQQLDAQMHDTIEHAIKSSMERVSEAEVKKVVQQAANKTAAIVEEARVASEANAQRIDEKVRQVVQETVGQAAETAAKNAAQQAVGESLKQTVEDAVGQAIAQREANAPPIDEKVRQVVQETVSHAAQEAAREAAQQASAQNLKQSVEEVVGRVIAEREASMPSLQVLTPPEAAQRHLEDWKKNLEQSAQDVRNQALAQSQSDAEAASRRWHEELEAQLAGSSTKLGEKLSEVSQTALANTENEIAGRTNDLRSLLGDVIAGAEASIQSLGAGLENERLKAEHARLQLEETAKSAVDQTRQRIDQLLADQQGTLNRSANETISAAQATVQSIGSALEQERARAEHAKAELAEAASSTVEQTRQRMDELVAAQQEAIGRKAGEVIESRIQQLEPVLRNSTQKVMEHFSDDLDKQLAPRLDEAQKITANLASTTQQAAELQNHLRQQADQASAHSARIFNDTRDKLERESEGAVQGAISSLANAKQQAVELQNHLRQQTEQASAQSAQILNDTRDKLQRESESAVQGAFAGLTNAKQQADQLQNRLHQQLHQASEQVGHLQNAALGRVQQESASVVQKAVAELTFAGEEAVRLQDVVREQAERARELAHQVGDEALQKIQISSAEAVQRAIVELANAEDQTSRLQVNIHQQVQIAAAEAADMEGRVREQMQQAAEQLVQQTSERMQQETQKYPAQFEQACRERITKVEEELDQKSSEMQHSAYEALLKSSEWYQKKAQTTMQSNMERVIEQSGDKMRETASEVSSMVASELDHYRRSYVEHGRGEIEEAAKEVTERERAKLNETAEIANATFTDRVQHVTAESLRRFQDSSRQAMERAHADMEFSRDGSLAEFQKVLDEKMTQGVEQAGTYLQSQLIPLMESWEAKREAEKKEWMQHIQQSSEESIAAYKARLDNATNAWLLASAATLGQNSQAVLDNLSKAAEKRMRDTCSQVLAGMGDMLRDRLLGISTTFTPKDEDDRK